MFTASFVSEHPTEVQAVVKTWFDTVKWISEHKAEAFAFLDWLLTPDPQKVVIDKLNGYPGLDIKYMPDAVREKYQDIAKAYSFGFSSKFSADMNQQWYEKVAGTPPPAKTP